MTSHANRDQELERGMGRFWFLREKAFVATGRRKEELGFINLRLLQYGKQKWFEFCLIKPLWIPGAEFYHSLCRSCAFLADLQELWLAK